MPVISSLTPDSSASAEDATRGTTTHATMPFALRLGGLPSALSDDAVTALLSHYGATRVRVLRRKKPGTVLQGSTERATQAAIAEFTSKERLLDAQQRLARVQLAGSKLSVEVAHAEDDNSVKKEDEDTRTTDEQAHAVDKKETVASTAKPTKATSHHANRRPTPPVNTPVPLAPHLGLNYAPSPLLQYKYPKATVPIVRNIANALIALPRFYTQVLHLMNKMNLPTPFEPDAIPGRFADAFMPAFQHHASINPHQPDHVEQVVEEDDDEEEEEDDREQVVYGLSSTNRGRPAAEQWRVTGKKRPRAAMETVSTPARDGFLPPRPGVISAAELDQQRLPEAVRASDPAFAGYMTGEASSRVRVSNLAESVDAKDLAYVFGHVLPSATSLESMQIERHSSTASAVLTFPTPEIAEQAVRQMNGVVLDGRPLVVRYEEKDTPTQSVDSPLYKYEPETPQSAAVSSGENYERMDSTLLAQEKAMKNYQRGDPTAALYLKNLTKAMDETMLRSLCRPFLPSSNLTDSVTIRHFTEGRMKNQAFMEFSTVEIATAVLNGIHGLVIHGKPLVVSFRKVQPSQPPTPLIQTA